MKIRLLVATSLLVVTASLSASAQQQPWLKDRRYGEGIGIRTGDLELHPGVEGEVGYDSNYFQRSGEVDAQVNEPVISAMRFRLIPSLTLSTLGAQRRSLDTSQAAPPTVNFRAGVNAGLNYLLATDSKYSKQVQDQSHIDAGANFNLDVLPERPWGAEFMGNFVRIAEASNSPDTNVAFNRDALRLGGGIVWRPGGGLFDWHLGYELHYNYFEKQAFRQYNNTQHYVKTRGRWRFLPRTALLYDASLGFISYQNATTQSDSTPVRARLGLNGLVTNHFALLAMAGWGASFYSPRVHPPQNFDSLIAQGELKWYVLPKPNLSPDKATVGLSSIALGYIRDFHNSYLGDYYGRDRGYLNFSYFAGGQVLLKLEGGFSHLRYPPSYYATGGRQFGAFSENRVDATLFGEYRLSDTFGINTTLRYNANLTETRIPVSPANAAFDNLKFNRFEAYLGARWFM